MPRVSESIVVRAPIGAVFDQSNSIEDWPRMMPDYTDAQVLGREGLKIVFQLTHRNGSSWRSWRILCPEITIAMAERVEPLHPFAHMQHVWRYEQERPDRTRMRWTMEFALAAPAEATDEEAIAYFRERMRVNQAAMTAFIERLATGSENDGSD